MRRNGLPDWLHKKRGFRRPSCTAPASSIWTPPKRHSEPSPGRFLRASDAWSEVLVRAIAGWAGILPSRCRCACRQTVTDSAAWRSCAGRAGRQCITRSSHGCRYRNRDAGAIRHRARHKERGIDRLANFRVQTLARRGHSCRVHLRAAILSRIPAPSDYTTGQLARGKLIGLPG